MWWPAIGGLVVGVGGLFQPQALGVGYDIIDDLLQGGIVPAASWSALILVKAVDLGVALGSGTSGGVLAPLLIMGGALGALESHVPARRRPGALAAGRHGRRCWAARCARRSPGVIFALELTHDINALPAAPDRRRSSPTGSPCW